MDASKKLTQLSLLLVDDDAELCSMIKEFFSQMGHHLDCAYNGRHGLARALNGTYDLALLDVMLPIVNGFTVLQQLRRRKEMPVIMLTARINRHDRIMGLDTVERAKARGTPASTSPGRKRRNIGEIRRLQRTEAPPFVALTLKWNRKRNSGPSAAIPRNRFRFI
jgi:CheY-like chemotaxis protein